MTDFVAMVIVILAALLGVFSLWLLWQSRGWPFSGERRAGTFAKHFIFIESDGSARELMPDEIEYLNTEFDPGDGARPYIKSRYKEKNGHGNLSGFLLRKLVPKRVRIAPAAT
jgi:hypothetical protein